MKVHLVFVIYFVIRCGATQAEEGKVAPQVTTVPIDEGSVMVLHLAPGYASSLRLPEAVSSVVIGNPATFKAEHSESEPRLVFFKPTSTQGVESNALITTKSGKEISLHLISAGQTAVNPRIDFLVEYRERQKPQSLLIEPREAESFVIAETRPITSSSDASLSVEKKEAKTDAIAQELAKQKALENPPWEGKEVLAAVGESIQSDHQTVVGFSVFNRSPRAIELLPPQIELMGKANKKQIKAEPIAISEYRLSTRRLEPGARADGVVVFDRPAFKESKEELQLQVAEADQIDRPLRLPLPFTANRERGK